MELWRLCGAKGTWLFIQRRFGRWAALHDIRMKIPKRGEKKKGKIESRESAVHHTVTQTSSIDRRMNHAPMTPSNDASSSPFPSLVSPRYATAPTAISFRRAASRLDFQLGSIENGATARMFSVSEDSLEGSSGTDTTSATGR